MSDDEIPIPADPEARARLAEFAGLTDEERHALDVWCFNEAAKRRQGIVSEDERGRL